MLIKSLLNQFERDWAEAALREDKLDLSGLKNKTIIVSGSSKLSRAVVISLLSANDNRGLGNLVCAYGTFSAELYGILREREDLIELKSLEEPAKNADIWIETEFLLNDNISVGEAKSTLKKAADNISIVSAVSPKRLLFLSDNSVYGMLDKGFVASEKESGNLFFFEDYLKTAVMQSVENIYSSAAHQYSFGLDILRCSSILCNFSNSRFINDIIASVSSGKSLKFDLSRTKTSYLYINDLITAVFYVLVYGNNTVYNACSDFSTVSVSELAVIINDLFDNVYFKVSDEEKKPVGCAVCNTKLKRLGWAPRVDIKDALLISVHAYSNSDKVFMFPDAYDGKLEKVQKILLGFLLEIDRICKKHNIKYFLAGGTLLGAIRHHGFIPWDDDADVMMLREDYDKFLSVLPSELGDNLFLQTAEKTSHFPFAKIRINNTVFSTEFTSRFKDVHNGIFFDVLAQDKTSNNQFIRKLHMHAAASSRWLVLNKWRGTPVDANSKFASFVANILKKILPLRFLEAVQNKLLSLYKNKKNADWLFDSMGRNISRGAFPRQWFDETVTVDFENVKLPVPKEYDKYLTYLYGDYMDMIPVSKRHVSHEIIEMDLGEYNSYQLRKN